MKVQKKEVAITIRFPLEVAQVLKEVAEANDRSFNGEVIRAAKEHIAWYKHHLEEEKS